MSQEQRLEIVIKVRDADKLVYFALAGGLQHFREELGRLGTIPVYRYSGGRWAQVVLTLNGISKFWEMESTAFTDEQYASLLTAVREFRAYN